MLAYVYDEAGKLGLRGVPEPEFRKDSAVMKVNACSVCGTDFRTYLFGSSKISAPRIIGHEAVGTIVGVGSEVAGFGTGDRVAVAPAIGCGNCRSCRDGHPNMCDSLKTVGFQYEGGFAEYMEIPADAFRMGNVNRLNDTVPDEEAALAEPIACVTNAHEYLKIKEGDQVLIFGSGFIGCMHAELAFKSGASAVIMVEMSPKRAEEAANLVKGITMIVPGKAGISEEVRRITGGWGADVAIVACSSGKAQEDAVACAAKRGRISLFGGIPGDSKGFIDSNEIHYRELSVFGVHASTPLQNRSVLKLITDGRLKVGKYISGVYALGSIGDAFEDIKAQKVMKAVIKP